MLIDISKLVNNSVMNIEVDEEVKVSEELLKEVGIISLKDTKVRGFINSTEDDGIYLDLILEGTMVLPCSITLKPVDYRFETEINGEYLEMLQEIENSVVKIDKTLDIFPIIWENILMEIPIKVTCPDATDLKLSGDGWKLVTDGEEKEVTSAFDKLKDLL